MTRVRIPKGEAGTRATLRQMRKIARQGVQDRQLVNLASRITEGRQGSAASTALALRGWLNSRVSFQRDPYGIETVREVSEMLADLAERGAVYGDCDDVAVLGAALGVASGLAARYVAVAFRADGPFRHVWTDVGDGLRWWQLDVTRPPDAPEPVRAMTLEV